MRKERGADGKGETGERKVGHKNERTGEEDLKPEIESRRMDRRRRK